MDKKQQNADAAADGQEVDQDLKKEDLKKDPAHKLAQATGEIGGPAGLEPTRYGDWERKGIISDF